MAYTKHTWSTGDLVTATDANHWETQYDCVFDTSAKTPTAAWTWQLAVGATSTDGLALETTTAATAGAQKYSPRMRLKGKGWKTNATAASQDVDFAWEVRPVQGAAAPTGQLVWSAAINGGSYTDLFNVTSGGVLTATQLVSTTQAIGPVGSESAPAWSFTGQTGYGMYYESSSVRLAVAGALAMRLSSSAMTLTTGILLVNNNRGSLGWSADGKIVLKDDAGTSFGLLQFGGTSASYPAWKRSGAGFVARLADDSADAAVTVSALTSQAGTITASAPAMTATQTWNNSGVTFTGWLLNITDTASAAGSLLANWQVGGSSKVAFSKAGAVTAASTLTVNAGGAVIKKASGAILEVNTGVARGSGNGYISISDPTGVKGSIGYSSAVADTFVVANDLNAAMYFATNGNIGVRIETTGALKFPYYGAGTLETDASGNVTATSDARMKTAVQPFTAGLRQILRVQPVSFRWRKRSGMDTRRRYTGFLAQNIERALGATSGVTVNQKTGLRSLSDKALIGALVNAVRELHADVETLKAAQVAA
jgi:hypothetical protein